MSTEANCSQRPARNFVEGEPMKPFHEMQKRDLAPHSLREEINARGYTLIRDLIPRSDIENVLGGVTNILFDAGWLLPGFDPLEHIADNSATCGDPDPSFKRTY